MTVLKGAALRTEAARLAQDGLRPAQIAVRLDRKSGTISAALSDARAAGIAVPCGRPGPPPGSQVDRRTAADVRHQRIAAMVGEGLQAREVAARIGSSASSVSATLSRMRSAGAPVPIGRRGPRRKVGAA